MNNNKFIIYTPLSLYKYGGRHPPSNILEIEVYMDSHKEEIVDFIEEKIVEMMLLNTRHMTSS
jgi:hypothetical protein